MSNHRYNTPEAGTLDWHIPLNENFERLDQDVEIRDVEANLGDYTPSAGAKFLATDSGATYTGDGSNWNLVGYVTRTSGGDIGHYIRYEDGLVDGEINTFFFGDDESLEVTRVSLPVRGLSADTTTSDVTLRVYEGGTGGSLLLELNGNDFARAATASSAPWVADTSPVTVTITNQSGEPVDVVPKVWANTRR